MIDLTIINAVILVYIDVFRLSVLCVKYWAPNGLTTERGNACYHACWCAYTRWYTADTAAYTCHLLYSSAPASLNRARRRGDKGEGSDTWLDKTRRFMRTVLFSSSIVLPRVRTDSMSGTRGIYCCMIAAILYTYNPERLALIRWAAHAVLYDRRDMTRIQSEEVGGSIRQFCSCRTGQT